MFSQPHRQLKVCWNEVTIFLIYIESHNGTFENNSLALMMCTPHLNKNCPSNVLCIECILVFPLLLLPIVLFVLVRNLKNVGGGGGLRQDAIIRIDNSTLAWAKLSRMDVVLPPYAPKSPKNRERKKRQSAPFSCNRLQSVERLKRSLEMLTSCRRRKNWKWKQSSIS